MSGQWKPGDVAMVTAANRREEYWAFFDGETWRECGHNLFCVNSPVTHRPLVVIDPEDREQVERLIAAYSSQPRWHTGYTRDRIDAMQAALREFANPTPPKPDEPTGLGAVVRDAEGVLWVRALSSLWSVAPWKREDCGQWGDWNGINAVEVLSEGVTP